MRDEMGRVIEKVIEASPPVAQGGLQAGVSRLQGEINKVFQPIRSEWFSDVVAQGQWEPVAAYRFVFRSKRLEDAFNRRQLGVLDRAFNDVSARDSNVVINWAGAEPRAELHRSQRGPDGRIMPNNTVFYTADKHGINKYVATVAKSIGKMVSGWYQVLNQLGRSVKSPFPGKGDGRVEFSNDKNILSLTATNETGNFNDMLSRTVHPQQLIMAAAQNCERRANAMIQGKADPGKGLMGQPSPPMQGPQASAANPAGSIGKTQPASSEQQMTMKQLALKPFAPSQRDEQSARELAVGMGMVVREWRRFQKALEEGMN